MDTSNQKLWDGIWRKFQYTQVKAKSVNEKFMPSIEQIPAVHDPAMLAASEWAIEKIGPGNSPSSYGVTGAMARKFLKGELSDGRYHKASHRLYRLVRTARAFTRIWDQADRDHLTVLRWIDLDANGAVLAARPL